MDQNFKFTKLTTSQFYPVTIFCCIFIFFLLERIGIAFGAVDPSYLACVPKTCGDGQRVSFPFYIENQQEPFCGYPGFQLSCNEKGNPVLNLPSNVYVINRIFYDNHSLRVSDAAVSAANNDILCNFPRLRNVSLPEDRFFLAPNQTAKLVVLYNCSSSLPEKFLRHKTGNCSSEHETGTVLALFEDDSDLVSALKECREKVVAPVDRHEEESEIKIGEMVRRGFLLQWIASDCSVCAESGGKCGFDESTYHFQCYCRDRPHAKHCTPGMFPNHLQNSSENL